MPEPSRTLIFAAFSAIVTILAAEKPFTFSIITSQFIALSTLNDDNINLKRGSMLNKISLLIDYCETPDAIYPSDLNLTTLGGNYHSISEQIKKLLEFSGNRLF